jgi:hypothetical protein
MAATLPFEETNIWSLIMKSLLTAAGAALLLATSAHAQTTTPAPTDTPAAPGAAMPAPSSPSATDPASPSANPSLTLNDAEANKWLNKTVYSSDDKNVGEVAQIARDAGGKVTELHADIGGFLGLGETRVRVMPEQFKLMGDRVVLNLTSEQAKSLPKIEKSN